VLIAAVLMVLYYMLPLDRPWDSDTAIRLLIGLVVVAGVMVWGVRIIAGSRYPGLRAAEALALILSFFLLPFASTYFVMERASAASFTQPLTRTGALHFTVTVFSRWGSGTSPPDPRLPGPCSSSRCSPTSRFSAPAYGCSWGRAARPGTTTGDGR
jgi:voltage-gated potassium channel